MIFRQLFDPQSSTYSYLLGDGVKRVAILIDPVLEQVRRDLGLLHDLGLTLLATVDTHVHADHVTGAAAIRARTGAQVCISASSGAAGADRLLADRDRIAFGTRWLDALATPGHTAGCMSFVMDDRSMAFTGDCLLIRGSGRTDFQGGSPHAMYTSVRERIFWLPDECLLYPGHDYRGITVTTVGEEKRFNPRLGGSASEADFTGHMQNLNLPHPKRIDEAVPANLQCGRIAALEVLGDDPAWAPLSYSFAGIWEVHPEWVEEHPQAAQIVDVRESAEFVGPLGHIDGARHIALGELAARQAELDRERPVVLVCRSGSRSAQASLMLCKAGFKQVANLAGGMLRWRSEGYLVVGGEG